MNENTTIDIGNFLWKMLGDCNATTVAEIVKMGFNHNGFIAGGFARKILRNFLAFKPESARRVNWAYNSNLTQLVADSDIDMWFGDREFAAFTKQLNLTPVDWAKYGGMNLVDGAERMHAQSMIRQRDRLHPAAIASIKVPVNGSNYQYITIQCLNLSTNVLSTLLRFDIGNCSVAIKNDLINVVNVERWLHYERKKMLDVKMWDLKTFERVVKYVTRRDVDQLLVTERLNFFQEFVRSECESLYFSMLYRRFSIADLTLLSSMCSSSLKDTVFRRILQCAKQEYEQFSTPQKMLFVT